MQQKIQFGQVVQPSVLSSVERTVKNCGDWWTSKSVRISAMIGEECSHGEVVLTNLVFTAGVVAMAILGSVFGG